MPSGILQDVLKSGRRTGPPVHNLVLPQSLRPKRKPFRAQSRHPQTACTFCQHPNFQTSHEDVDEKGRREEENDGGIKWRRLSVVCAPPPPPPPPRNYSTNSPSARAPASVDRPTNKQRGNVRVRPPNFFRVLESNLLEGERGREGSANTRTDSYKFSTGRRVDSSRWEDQTSSLFVGFRRCQNFGAHLPPF